MRAHVADVHQAIPDCLNESSGSKIVGKLEQEGHCSHLNGQVNYQCDVLNQKLLSCMLKEGHSDILVSKMKALKERKEISKKREQRREGRKNKELRLSKNF